MGQMADIRPDYIRPVKIEKKGLPAVSISINSKQHQLINSEDKREQETNQCRNNVCAKVRVKRSVTKPKNQVIVGLTSEAVVRVVSLQSCPITTNPEKSVPKERRSQAG